jgi:hypothetical protein
MYFFCNVAYVNMKGDQNVYSLMLLIFTVIINATLDRDVCRCMCVRACVRIYYIVSSTHIMYIILMLYWTTYISWHV